MCWIIKIGRCGHPEPVKTAVCLWLTAFPAERSCNDFTRAREDQNACSNCNKHHNLKELSEADYRSAVLRNRNLTYYLEVSNKLGLKFPTTPELEEAALFAVPPHVRFAVGADGSILRDGDPVTAAGFSRMIYQHKQSNAEEETVAAAMKPAELCFARPTAAGFPGSRYKHRQSGGKEKPLIDDHGTHGTSSESSDFDDNESI